jgi:O-antigen/teichoic acid export membrane protein
MNKLKQLAGETALYGLGSIIPRFFNFFLVFIHTSVFQPEDFGIITKLFAYVAVINTIFMFGMETAYFRFANKKDEDESRIFNITLTAVFAISGTLSLLLIIFSKQTASFLEVPDRRDLVIYLVLIMFIDAIVAIPFARLRFRKKALNFAVYKLVNIAILMMLNVYLLKFSSFTPDISFVIIANVVANAFYLLFFFRTLISWRPVYDHERSPTIFSYAYPIMLTGLAGMTNEMFSRITLENWLPENFYPGKSTKFALGVFGACYRFAVLMNLAIIAFRYAAEPFFFSNASEKNSPQLFARVNHYFIIACCILLLGVSINLDILKHFLAKPAYWEGLHIVPILLLAYLFLGVYYNISAWFKLTDKTYVGTLITTAGAIITIAANYFLIPMYGYEGSSWAALICYATMTVMCYVLGQKYYPVPYGVVSGLGYIVGTMFLIYIVNQFSFESQVVATSLHTLIILIYLLVIFFREKKDLKRV